VYDARQDTVRALFEDAIGAWYVPTGHVLYLTSSGTLMAVPWNNGTLAATGPAVPILDGIQAPGLVLSDEGTALYLLGRPEFTPGPTPNSEVVWVDRSGRVEPVDSSWQVNTGGSYGEGDDLFDSGWGLALSPDGRRIALTLLTFRLEKYPPLAAEAVELVQIKAAEIGLQRLIHVCHSHPLPQHLVAVHIGVELRHVGGEL
jgi:hypothetical protein